MELYLKNIILFMKIKGYIIYKEPYKLNIVGVRSKDLTSKYFDEDMYVFWYNDKGKLEHRKYLITTKPSEYYLKNPISDQMGTGILKEAQFIDNYEIGSHKGKYKALVQKNSRPVIVYRNTQQTGTISLDDTNMDLYGQGFNIHRASANERTNEIGSYSAGCQVFSDPNEFIDFIELAEKHKDLYGNKFTYTLIHENDLKKFWFFSSVSLIIITGLLIYYLRQK